MRPKRESHAGQLECPKCRLWLHTSRFRKKQSAHSTVPGFERLCRLCEQTDRTDQKHADLAHACVESRAAALATKLEKPRAFVMHDLNYRALIPVVRAMLTDPAARCGNCSHPFKATDKQRDIQLDHRAPPRHRQDWARYHARNVCILCGSCNRAKHKKPYETWLDDEEANRLSANAQQRVSSPERAWRPPLVQASLFD